MRSQRPEAGRSILVLVVGRFRVLIRQGGDVVEVERHRRVQVGVQGRQRDAKALCDEVI